MLQSLHKERIQLIDTDSTIHESTLMKLSALLLFAVLNLLIPQTSTFTILGSVRNQAGQPVTNVRISVTDENFQPIRTIFVDSSGKFTIRGLGQGKFSFRVETTGTPYEEQVQQLDLQSLRLRGGNETYPLDIVLKFKRGNEPLGSGGAVFIQDVPKAARTEYERAVNHLKGKKTDKVIASLKKAIEIFPDYYHALELLGSEYVKSDQYEVAIPLLTRALEINRRGAKSAYALGVASLKLNRMDDAIEWLEKSDHLDPINANTQMMLGLAYGNNGSFDKSEASFKKALNFGGAAAAEARLYLAGLYNRQDRYRAAWQELEIYLKEAKDIKDRSQIKSMIEKLKEKETSKQNEPQSEARPTSSLPTNSAPSSGGVSNADISTVSANTSTPSETLPEKLNGRTRENMPVPTLTPEIQGLLDKSAINGGVMHKQLLDYTYQLKKTRRILNERGQSTHTQEELFEAYPVKGEHVLILLSRDGVPSLKLSDDRKRASKQLEEAENNRAVDQKSRDSRDSSTGDYVSAGISGIYNGKPAHISVSISAFLRYCEFYSPRFEKMGDRMMVALSFRPRYTADIPKSYSYINKLTGTIWIDQSDKIVARLEGWTQTEGAFGLAQAVAPSDKASLIYQQDRLPDGSWFPQLIRLNADGRSDLFDGLNWDVVFEFSNYQRFSTTATDKTIDPSRKTP
jgi:tetratricopeptide (TPR) repeat protein